MKQPLLQFLSTLALLAVVSTPSQGQIILTASPLAPTPGLADIYNINSPNFTGSTNPSLGSQFGGTGYSDVNGHSGTGESFTIGGSSATLNSVSILGGGDGANYGNWNIAIYQVTAGTTLGPVLTSALSLANPDGITTSSWLTFSFAGANAISLAADTQYAFQITTANNYYGFGVDTNSLDTVAGARAVDFNSTVGNATAITNLTYSGQPYQYAFDVGLTTLEAPEPSTYVMLAAGLVLLVVMTQRRLSQP